MEKAGCHLKGHNMTPENASAAAGEICAARLGLRPLGRLPSPLQPDDEAEAYQVQDVLNESLSEPVR